MKDIKKILPSSMAAQMIMVVLLALMVAQGVSLVILGGAYRTTLSDINQKTQLRQLGSLVQLLEENEPATYASILNASSSGSVRFSVNTIPEVKPANMTTRENRIIQRLLWRMGEPYQGRIFVAINEPDDNARKIQKALNAVKGEQPDWQSCGGSLDTR